MRTDKSKYYNDENIMILGNVYDNNLKLTNTVLSVTPIFNETSVLPSFLPSFLPIFLPFLPSSHETKHPLILQKTEIPVIDGIYNFTLYLNKQGFYNISISDKGGNNERFLIVEAKNKFSSYTFLLIYFTIGLLILYCIITWFAVSNEPKIASKLFKYEIYRFFILSSISLIPLISFFVMDVEIGKFSPIGLVMKNIENATDVQQILFLKSG